MKKLSSPRGHVASALRKIRTWINLNAGVILIAFSLVIGTGYGYQVYQERQSFACQARYNQAFNTQLKERSRLGTASDEAKNEFIRAMGLAFVRGTSGPPPSKEEQAKRLSDFLQLFTDFNTKIDAVAKDRAEHPLPETPSC